LVKLDFFYDADMLKAISIRRFQSSQYATQAK